QLKAAGEAEPGAFMRDQPVEPLPVERDTAGLVVQRAAQTVDERRLAGAVWTDQPEPLSPIDRQIDAFQRDKAAKPLAEPGDVQNGCGVAHGDARRSISIRRSTVAANGGKCWTTMFQIRDVSVR